jgi:hypothetical protein
MYPQTIRLSARVLSIVSEKKDATIELWSDSPGWRVGLDLDAFRKAGLPIVLTSEQGIAARALWATLCLLRGRPVLRLKVRCDRSQCGLWEFVSSGDVAWSCVVAAGELATVSIAIDEAPNEEV